MTDRLDRIEKTLDRVASGLEETKAIANSNSRAIQAMMEQRATDRLEHEERITTMREEISTMQEAIQTLIRIEDAQNKMLAKMDDDRPTVLRKLNTIENKLDTLIDRQN